VNTDLIDVRHDDVSLIGIYADGNEANQVDQGVPDRGHQNVIESTDCTRLKILRCKIVEGFNIGVRLTSATTDYEVAWNVVTGNQANGLTAGANTTQRGSFHDNIVSESSDVGISSYGDHVTIENNIVYNINSAESPWGGNGNIGIAFEGTVGGTYGSHSKATDNLVFGCPGSGIVTISDAADGGDDVQICNNSIYDVGIGVRISKYNDVLVADNKIDTTTDVGILVDSVATEVSLEDNQLKNIGDDNADHGIRVNLPDGIIVKGNKLKIIAGHGIYISGSVDSEVIDNRVEDVNNSRHGIYVTDTSTRPKISGNTLIDIEGYGMNVATSNDPQITDNKIYNTGDDGIRLATVNNALIEGNKIITAVGYCLLLEGNVDDARVSDNYTLGGTVGDVGIANV